MLGHLGNITRHVLGWTATVKPRQIGSTIRLSCLWRVVMLLFVLGITVGVSLNQDRLQGLAALGYAGAFLVMLLSNATLVLPAPGLIFVFALGNTLHPVLVGLFAAMGATLGELTGYLTGYSGLAILEDTPLVHRVNVWMARNGTLTIFILSIVPNPLFDLAGILAGASRISVWRFLGVAFCGKTIQATAIALAGALSLGWVQEWLTH